MTARLTAIEFDPQSFQLETADDPSSDSLVAKMAQNSGILSTVRLAQPYPVLLNLPSGDYSIFCYFKTEVTKDVHTPYVCFDITNNKHTSFKSASLPLQPYIKYSQIMNQTYRQKVKQPSDTIKAFLFISLSYDDHLEQQKRSISQLLADWFDEGDHDDLLDELALTIQSRALVYALQKKGRF